MKAVQANNWRQANDSTHKDEVDPAHKIIMEIDALWRMSYGYGTSLHCISMRDDGISTGISWLPLLAVEKRVDLLFSPHSSSSPIAPFLAD